MDEKTRVLIEAIKSIVSDDKKIDFNKEQTEREAKIKCLKESFDKLILILEEGGEARININEKIDEIIKQLNEFRISKMGSLKKVLPAPYEKDLFSIPEIEEIKE